ncbi:flagellar hook-basal body complex protein FliE [Pseudooceanicola sp.]|uniref:flagellar hook-basal body complex protein FliE n=1 Tax=Pseudooceanicola sp. TaxID=1914328 RepID=UPI00405A3AE8
MAEITSLISNAAVDGAYRSSREIKSTAPFGQPMEEERKVSFSDMVGQAGADMIHNIRTAEAKAQEGLSGRADTQQVVEATLQLDSTVKVAVAVRDKLVEAYQEIMRMPV